jgi:hypothetical protein
VVSGLFYIGARGTFSDVNIDITITDIQVEQNGTTVATPFIFTGAAAVTVTDQVTDLNGNVTLAVPPAATATTFWTGTSKNEVIGTYRPRVM